MLSGPFVKRIGQLVKPHFHFAIVRTRIEETMSRLTRSTIRRWLMYWLAWTAVGLFYISQDFMTRIARSEDLRIRTVVIVWMSAVYISAAFTPTVLRLGQHWPIEGVDRWRNLGFQLGASLVFSLVSTVLEVPVLSMAGIIAPSKGVAPLVKDFWLLLTYDLHGGIVRYWVVIGLQALFRSNQEARRREREALELEVHSSLLAEQLTSSQLSALKMQLHPHFLFNTLSAVMVLVRQQKGPKAETMLSRLSDLLRHTLEDVDTQEVPLWCELDFLRLYLSIEQVRFEDRLRVQIDAGPEVSDALVPHMALQPIVENAVRHGLGQSEEPVLIHVSVSKMNGSLKLTVTDDGPGCATPFFGDKGIGLKNTRNRLARLYGSEATFSAESQTPHGVQVTMIVPYRTQGRE
jgi:signal transduction histidine kinase